ncbi:MAG TPA: hypothetical protein VLF62_03105 [Candidatus Saccharimonadales bacterium]|nr:hypothetical protein [Candidatus Saccharimonadales bacterium]
MSRLPVPGSDDDVWGDVLNDFLSVAHDGSGKLKPSAIQTVGGVVSVNGVAPSNGNVTLTAGDVGASAPVPQAVNVMISKSGSNAVATKVSDGSQLYSGADGGAALSAAITSVGAGGGVIMFQPGAYAWATTPALPPNLTGWLQIVGSMATINLSVAGNRFLDFGKLANGDTFRYLHIDGFIVDAAALSGTGGTRHIVLGTYRPSDGITSGTNVNFSYLTLRNIVTKNVRVANSGTAHFLNIFLGIHQDSSGLPENKCEHILMENIDMQGGNHGITIYGNKNGAWSGDPTIKFDDIVVRHVRHDMVTAPTAFDSTSHVHVSSLGYGSNVLIDDVWGYGSRDVAVEVDATMNPRISNVVAEDYMGFAVALTNYNNPTQYLAQHAYVRNIAGYRSGGQAQASSSSVVGVRTTGSFKNGHFTLENISHYRSATAPDLSTSPLAGDLVSVKGSIESLTLNGGTYEAVGAVLSGSSGQAAQIVYVDDLTSTRTRISISNLDVRFRGAKGPGATAGIALSAVQVNGSVDVDINNVRLYVDFPTIEQVTGVDLGSASGGTMRGKIESVKVYGPNLGGNAKGVFVPASGTVTIPAANALRIRYVDEDALPAGAAVFVGDATNRSLIDLGILPLAAAVKTVTANYTITGSDGVVIVNSSGAVTVSLPSATTSGAGKQYIVRSTGTGQTAVNALGGNIDGLAQVSAGTTASVFVSDGTNWQIISSASSAAISHFARTVSANYSLTDSDGVVLGSTAGITLTLPSGTVSGAGKQFTLKNISNGIISANAAGGTIDGGFSVSLAINMSQTYVSDGTNWVLLFERGADALLKAAKIVTSNYNVASNDGIIFANGAAVTVTLPSATGAGAGKTFAVKNINAANAFVNAAGGNVEGIGQATVGQNISYTFASDGTDWWQI